MGVLQPLNIFLRQEVDRMQKVITLVRSTLIDLKLGIDGTIIMSEKLQDALDNMFNARVPQNWKKVSNLYSSSNTYHWYYKHLIIYTGSNG